jgi:AraC-like DNA-binding protein
MPVSQFSRPARCLEPFVRFYIQRDVRILGATVIHPVPARPAPMIVFDFNDPTDVLYYGQSSATKSPSAVVVGPQTYRRLEMQLRGALDTFVIGFQPDGIFRLFSVPTKELTDFDFEAHSVLGSVITKLGERLGNATSFAERVQVVEEALLPRALLSTGLDGVSVAAHGIISAGGRTRIPDLAAKAGLGVRQFERNFLRQVGMRPKLFARIVRFEAALEFKARLGTRSWADVAHRFGYYDQMHMVHDFAEFTGATPSETLDQLETVYVEQIKSLRTGRPTPSATDPLRLVF